MAKATDGSRTKTNYSGQAQRKRSLTEQVLSGLLWLFAGTGAQMIFRTIVMVILSRLLTPGDFGVVAAAMVVINFADTISHLGIGPAITQRPELSEAHIRTAFTFSMVVGGLFFFGAQVYVPLVADLFDMQELQPILYVVSALFPLRSLGLVAESLMTRDLKFHLTTRIEVLSYGLGYGLVGIVFSFLGHGSWALVYATLAQASLRSILLVAAQAHSKKPLLDLKAFRELLVFGGGFTLARIGNTLALQGDNFVIGRWLGPFALGLYGRAYQLMVTPASLFGAVLDKVLFPAMAKVQNDQARLALSFRRGVAMVAVVVLPAIPLLYILAPEIVSIVLGSNWSDVVAPFRILVLGTLFRTSYKISDSIARATGAVYRRAWRQGVYAILVFLGAWIGQHWGLNGVSVGVTLALMSNFALMAHLSLALTSLSQRDFVLVHIPPARLALLTMAITLPTASVFRSWQVSDWILVPAVILFVATTALGLATRYPRTFLGPDGVWIVKLLSRYVPEPLQRFVRASRGVRDATQMRG